MTENASGVMVSGFIGSLNVTIMVLSSGTPVARFAGSVDTTSGQTPGFSTNLSFLHPPKNAAINRAAIVVINNPFSFVFIILLFRMDSFFRHFNSF